MPSAKLSAVCTWVSVCTLVALSACSSNPTDPSANWSTSQIHAEAKELISSGTYDKAVVLLEKLEGRAAGTPLAQQAQVDKAYAQFKSGEPIVASATLDRFIKLHPASPAVDYALYLKGIVNFNDDLGLFSSVTRQDLSERDQKSAKDSFESFKELVTRFPDSRYTPDASLRMRYIIHSLAKSEVHVAQYYFERGAYLAAINRAQTALVDYPGVPALQDALIIMVKSYDALGMTQMRDDTRRVLEKNYAKTTPLTQNSQSGPEAWWKFW